MSTWNRIARKYRQGGIKGIAFAVAARVFSQPAPAYQVKRAHGLEERWKAIDRAIPANTASVLDVGCNLGDIAARCAKRGMFTIGVDRDISLVRAARQRHLDVPKCGFVCVNVDPHSIRKLLAFEAVLLLSVHHHWLIAYGPEATKQMLQVIADRTEKVMIFEAPSRRIRYGDYQPGFIDNDEASVTAYLESYISSTFGRYFSRMVALGRTPCVGEREPYRWSYALYK